MVFIWKPQRRCPGKDSQPGLVAIIVDIKKSRICLEAKEGSFVAMKTFCICFRPSSFANSIFSSNPKVWLVTVWQRQPCIISHSHWVRRVLAYPPTPASLPSYRKKRVSPPPSQHTHTHTHTHTHFFFVNCLWRVFSFMLIFALRVVVERELCSVLHLSDKYMHFSFANICVRISI